MQLPTATRASVRPESEENRLKDFRKFGNIDEAICLRMWIARCSCGSPINKVYCFSLNGNIIFKRIQMWCQFLDQTGCESPRQGCGCGEESAGEIDSQRDRNPEAELLSAGAWQPALFYGPSPTPEQANLVIFPYTLVLVLPKGHCKQ